MRRKIILYNPKLKERTRNLRKNMTIAEKVLWFELRGNKLMGYDFDRQRPIDEYIVDFYCKDLMLAIEVDGATHDDLKVQENDKLRQARLELLGVSSLRFTDYEIEYKLNEVLETIRQWILKNR